jgi:hypothetical protein
LKLPWHDWTSRGSPGFTFEDRVYDALHRKIELVEGVSRIEAEFATDDETACRRMQQVEVIFQECFRTGVEVIDLKTDRKVRTIEGGTPYSIDIVDWCRKSDNRFITETLSDRNRVADFWAVRPQASR